MTREPINMVMNDMAIIPDRFIFVSFNCDLLITIDMPPYILEVPDSFPHLISVLKMAWISQDKGMEQKETKDIIPDQQTGQAIYAESSVAMNDEMSAMIFFEEIKKRLSNVNSWHTISGALTAKFQLVNNKLKTVERTVRKGDYIKIDIPGPGSRSGNGFDWVTVEELESMSSQDEEFFGFRVRPTVNPLNERDDIAHFYSPESTSTFTVIRIGIKITAGVYDRNVKPNEDADFAIDKIRDTVVATAGLVTLSKVQWQKLTDGLLK